MPKGLDIADSLANLLANEKVSNPLKKAIEQSQRLAPQQDAGGLQSVVDVQQGLAPKPLVGVESPEADEMLAEKLRQRKLYEVQHGKLFK